MNITQNFTRAEVAPHNKWEDIPSQHRVNLVIITHRLQVIRDLLQRRITITSGYRDKAYNASIGGAKDSYHTRGEALDFTVEGMTPRMVQEYLKNWSGGMGYGKTFTHIDTGPYRRWNY